MAPDKVNLAVLFHRIGPYHFARLHAIGSRMPTVAIELSREDSTYAWDEVKGEDGFRRITLFTEGDAGVHPRSVVAERVRNVLNQCQPLAVVVPGWSGPEALAAIEWCNARRVPIIVMSESTEWDEPRVWWKEWIKRRILKTCVGGLVGGKPHAEYLARLGVPGAHIFQGYDAVDNDYFAARTAAARSQEPGARSELGLPEKFFLASARFVEKKNLPKLIQAYARYRVLVEEIRTGKQKAEIGSLVSDPWPLIVLGDGPVKSEITELIARLGLQQCVILPGFKQYHELPAYYGRASVFIHASTTEQWGLVVNEAMASGLPVLVSNRCGCAQDLVQEGVNGFVFNPCHVEEMAELMLKISDFRFPISDFGAASQRIISQWGPERFAGGLQHAVQAALAVPPAKPTLLDRLILKLLLMK